MDNKKNKKCVGIVMTALMQVILKYILFLTEAYFMLSH